MKKLFCVLFITIFACIVLFTACGETSGNNLTQENELTPSIGLEFENNDNSKTCSVSGIGACTDSDIVIPKEQNGYAVTSIKFDAFFRNSSITSVTIQDGVTYIGKSAFAVCKELKTITIPKSLTVIESEAFFNCINLETIIYQGTKEQWSSVTLNSNWDAGVDNYKIICTDGEIPKEAQ